MNEDTDPFEQYTDTVSAIDLTGVRDSNLIQDIVRQIDYVRYHAEYLRFINTFKARIYSDQKYICSVLSSSITNRSLGKPGFDDVVKDMAFGFRRFIVNTPLLLIDLNTLFNVIRSLIEVGLDIHLAICVLMSKVISMVSEGSASDVTSILSNHHDVLKSVYETDHLYSFACCLGEVIDRTSS